MNDLNEKLLERLGKEFFALEAIDKVPVMAQNRARFVTICVMRETIGPVIDRSDDPECSITQTITDKNGEEREVVEIPARKFKSKEKLMGLKLCRAFNVVSTDYEYNHVVSPSYLDNPNSVIFGDSVVEGGDAGQAMLPSKVFYSSSYSIRSRALITKKLTHNALSEEGTMWDRREGKNRQSLFNTEYITPGVFFPSFITLSNPTPEALIHVILSLKQMSYGAQTAITGPNIKNTLVAIYSGRMELPITSYTISKNFDLELLKKYQDVTEDSDMFRESINSTVLKAINEEKPDHILFGAELQQILARTYSLSYAELMEVYSSLKEQSIDLIKFSKIIKEKKPVKEKQKELQTEE